MTTNDEQAPYFPAECAPMLSDAGFKAMCDTGDGTVSFETGRKMREVRDFYESLIASGELRVVKKDQFPCSQCGEYPA